MRSVAITGADAGFFGLVQGTVSSLRRHRRPGMELAFLDLGLEPEQLAWVREHVEHVVVPGWDFEFPDRDQAPGHLRAILARPFFHRYFPGFDVYLWVDADAWVQEGLALDLYLGGAAEKGMAVTCEVHRSNGLLYGLWKASAERFGKFYRIAYGEEIAERIRSFPMLNAGVFAIRHDAPHWKAWERRLGEGIVKYRGIVDQLGLNLAIHLDGLADRTAILPGWCNWTTHAAPVMWDPRRRVLVDPHLPHFPIGILHLTMTKYETLQVHDTEGRIVEARMRFPGGLVERPAATAAR